MKFKGQVSKVWIGVIAAMNIFMIVMCVANGFTGVTYVLIPVLVLMNIIICPAIFINNVEVTKKIFIIHYGFSTAKFLIDDIVSIYKTDRLFGTYAVGSDRICCKTKNQKEIVVSLEDNKGFINELKRQNKKIKIFV